MEQILQVYNIAQAIGCNFRIHSVPFIDQPQYEPKDELVEDNESYFSFRNYPQD